MSQDPRLERRAIQEPSSGEAIAHGVVRREGEQGGVVRQGLRGVAVPAWRLQYS